MSKIATSFEIRGKFQGNYFNPKDKTAGQLGI
jgi:hypothetical protein